MTVVYDDRGTADMDSIESKDEKQPSIPQSNNSHLKAVTVILRVRPLSTIEHANPSVKSVVQCLKDGIIVSGPQERTDSRFYGSHNAIPRPQHFKVNQVFHPHDTQLEVYAACRPIVAACLEGINGSILAYGATGSGKTHTMFGASMSAAGVVYQAMQDILEAKERLERENHKVVTLRCSFLEVYNEEVYDLLVPPGPWGKRTSLHLHDLGLEEEDSSLVGVNPESLAVKGLTHVTPATGEEFAKCIERGHMNRFVASTNANAHSSRSHAILTVEVEVQDTLDASLGTMGRIRFCDLAGSERAAGTSNSGIRLREGGNINRSLLALGAVVQALGRMVKHPKRRQYVPYRGSKLTRVLRDCLGGTCSTLMLFCVSPSSLHYDETINTMLFALQVKEIQVQAKRHELRADPKEIARSQEMLIEDLRSELATAREELLRLRGSGAVRLTVAHPAQQLNPEEALEPQPLSAVSPSLNSSIGYSGKVVPPLGTEAATVFPAAVTGESVMAETRQSSMCLSRQGSLDRRSVEPFFSRVPLQSEIADTYTELQMKLKALSVTKESLYRDMKEAQEKSSELNVLLRQQNWKLAHFLLSNSNKSANMHAIDSNGINGGTRLSLAGHVTGNGVGNAAPVGVARLRHSIEQMTKESAARGDEMERLLVKMNETDHAIASVREALLRERQHPLLELLLDNVRLRQSRTEAECLAAHYHQQCRASKNREEEYTHALSICTSVIRRAMPLINKVSLRGEGQRALTYAKLPFLTTEGMVPACDRSLPSASLQPEALSSPSQLLSLPVSPVREKATTKGAHVRKASAGVPASLLSHGQTENSNNNALKQRGKTTTSAPTRSFTRSYTTSALLRDIRSNGVKMPVVLNPTYSSTTTAAASTTVTTASPNTSINANTKKTLRAATATTPRLVSLKRVKRRKVTDKPQNAGTSAARVVAPTIPFSRSYTAQGLGCTKSADPRMKEHEGVHSTTAGSLHRLFRRSGGNHGTPTPTPTPTNNNHNNEKAGGHDRLQNAQPWCSPLTSVTSSHSRTRVAQSQPSSALSEKECTQPSSAISEKECTQPSSAISEKECTQSPLLLPLPSAKERGQSRSAAPKSVRGGESARSRKRRRATRLGKNAHVTFAPLSARNGTKVSHLQRGSLEARFDKLLSEVRHWQERNNRAEGGRKGSQ